MAAIAICHPERKHISKGMCKQCYEKSRYGARPERRQRIVETKKLRRLASNDEYLTKVYREYGLSRESYFSLLEKQNNLCAICGLFRKLVVDHIHGTEKVRGLLCVRCNLILGQIEGPYFEPAMAYLKMHGTSKSEGEIQ